MHGNSLKIVVACGGIKSTAGKLDELETGPRERAGSVVTLLTSSSDKADSRAGVHKRGITSKRLQRQPISTIFESSFDR